MILRGECGCEWRRLETKSKAVAWRDWSSELIALWNKQNIKIGDSMRVSLELEEHAPPP